MEIIEAVAILRLSLGLLLPGNGFLKLAFFVCGIQKPDILQRMYVFLFPAGEDLICILETGLSGGKDSTAAGFLDQLQIKTVGLAPGINVSDLVINRIAAADPHSLQDRVIILGKTGAGIPGHLDGDDAVFCPGECNSFNITHTLAASGNTVFHQIFDEIRRHMEFIIEKKDLLHFWRRQCFGQILLCDIEKLTDLFVLLKFSDPVRSETENVISGAWDSRIRVPGNGSRIAGTGESIHGSAALYDRYPQRVPAK